MADEEYTLAGRDIRNEPESTKRKFIVPDELMVPLGAEITKDTGKCADSWTDSTIASYRAKLPVEYQAVPVEDLRRRWISIRKKGTDGFRTSGKGPAVGSRKKVKRKKPPAWYDDYLDSEWWKKRKEEFLVMWGRRCSFCNAKGLPAGEVELDVHHRTYERLNQERNTDCVVMCRRCHDLFHDYVEVEK